MYYLIVYLIVGSIIGGYLGRKAGVNDGLLGCTIVFLIALPAWPFVLFGSIGAIIWDVTHTDTRKEEPVEQDPEEEKQ